MTEKTHAVPNGVIHYWMNDFQPGRAVLVFLPGLTADHRLFDKQVEAFESTYNLLAWDAPGHGKSRPFVMDFTLAQKAAWLHAILQAEGITAPVLVGQSVGGYLSQAYIQAYPGEVRGFVSIDSAPLKRKYMSDKEFWMLNHMAPVYSAPCPGKCCAMPLRRALALPNMPNRTCVRWWPSTAGMSSAG